VSGGVDCHACRSQTWGRPRLKHRLSSRNQCGSCSMPSRASMKLIRGMPSPRGKAGGIPPFPVRRRAVERRDLPIAMQSRDTAWLACTIAARDEKLRIRPRSRRVLKLFEGDALMSEPRFLGRCQFGRAARPAAANPLVLFQGRRRTICFSTTSASCYGRRRNCGSVLASSSTLHCAGHAETSEFVTVPTSPVLARIVVPLTIGSVEVVFVGA
jgi:hypothetical protein